MVNNNSNLALVVHRFNCKHFLQFAGVKMNTLKQFPGETICWLIQIRQLFENYYCICSILPNKLVSLVKSIKFSNCQS